MDTNTTQVTQNQPVNAKPNGQLSELDQLKMKIAQAEAKIVQLETERTAKIKMAVSEKGAISFYGLGKFPVTLYRSQLEAIIPMFKNGTVEAFITANSDKLATKGDK